MTERKVISVHDPFNVDEKLDAGPHAFPPQPQIRTMAKKIAIEAAVPGNHPVKWYRERGVDSLPPITVDDQVNAIVECVKAGASVIHIHPRDPKTGMVLIHATEIMAEIVDRAMEQVDFVTVPHTWAWDFTKNHAVDYVSYTEELLQRGKGNKYCQAALVMTMGAYGLNHVVFTRTQTREGVQWLEEHGVKPMYSMQASAFMHYKHELWDKSISKWEPYWIAINLGKHSDDQIFADPWSYLQVINNMSLIRSALPDAYITLQPAGRNWLPVTTVGLLYGAELVRVGIEDQFYLWPDRDDISKKASDTVEIVATLAKSLGREIATAQDVRDRLNITFTSPH